MNRIPIGTSFNRLTLLEVLPYRAKDNHLLGRWLCQCGKKPVAMLSRVKAGLIKSCGCLITDTKPNLMHGGRFTAEYSSWSSMRDRCLNVKSKDYPRYGAKGITVCDRWNDFSAFLADMGLRPHPAMSLDRIDGSKGYEPGNVRWASAKTQARNKSNFTVVSTPKGRMPLVDYAEILGITRGAAHLRLKRGKLEGCVRV